MKKTNKRNRKRIVALALGLVMAVAYVPGPAFAAGGEGTPNIDELKAVAETAQKAMQDAQDALDTAQKGKDAAQQAMNNAASAYQTAERGYEEAQAAVTEATETMNAGFQAKKDAAAKALSDAKDDLEQANKSYNSAVSTLETRIQELQAAVSAKEGVERDIATLNEEKDAAQAQVESLPAQITAAEQALASKNSQWENEKQEAADAVAEAQEAYDEAGYDFLNNKIDALGSAYYTLPEMIEISKGYTNKNLGKPCTFNGNSIATIADVANDALFLNIVKSNCTKENLLLAMDMIDESNLLRQAENKSVMGVSYQLMGAAIMSNSYSIYSFSHDLLNANGKDANGYANTNSFWAIGPATWGNENLHASTARITSAAAPFNGWYHNEKAALQQAVNSGNWPGLSMDQSTRYIWTNYPNLSYETNQAGYGQVGHYLTLKNEEYTTTGMAVAYNSGTVPTQWRGRATQSFNDDTENSISVEQCRSEINAAFTSTETALNTALAAQEALETKPDYVTAAEEALATKQQALTEAQQTVQNKTTAIEQKNGELASARQNITTKTTEKQEAKDAKDAAESAMAAAQDAKDDADAANTKAQALDPDDPDTYAGYDDLKTLVEAVTEATTTAADKETAKEEAENNKTQAENALNNAQTTYNNAKATYDTAKQEYETAAANYDSAASVKNAEITIEDVTYDGSEQKPQVTVVLNEKTLSEDTDYSVAYDNNVNAGDAIATITGSGNYTGTVVKTFVINKAANTLVTNGKTVKLKAKKVKKKKQTIAVGKAFSVSGNKGNVTYKKVSGNKKITVASNGKITVKKKTKKGTYKIKVNVTAAGDRNYGSVTKTVTTTVRVK